GCDHTQPLILTINSSTSGTTTVTACDSYIWSGPLGNGQTYTASGTFTHVTQNAAGCDHTQTLVLTINSSTSGTSTVTACDSYTWSGPLGNGQTYTQSGTFTHVTQNAAGCDHTQTLVLTINSSTSGTTTVTACDSYVWAENGQTYSQSGTFTHVSTNAAGCPHTETLILTINNSTSSFQNESACDAYTWSVNGQTYTASGIYTHQGLNVNGCTHTFTLDLTINLSTSSTSSISSCDSYTWDKTGLTYTQSGTYTSHDVNASGCIHTYFLILEIRASTSSNQTVTECDSYTWSLNNQTYFQSGTYMHTSINASGCTHTFVLNLTINSSSSSSMNVTACNSYTWSLNNQTYTQSGTYTHLGTNSFGCPHLTTLHLTINPNTSSSETVVACRDYTWPVNNIKYFNSGVYTHVGTNQFGCSHTYTLNLTIHPNTQSSQTIVACDSYTWPVNGVTYTTNGTRTHQGTNANGCVHIYILNLTIKASSSSSQTVTACDSYVWSLNGQTYTQSGVYTHMTTNANGCPHTNTLNLTINYSSSSSMSATVCDNYLWAVNDQTYNQSGTYIHMSTNASGCSHTSTLILIVNSSSNSSISATACDSYVWSENGQTYTQSGTYTHVSTNAAGCPHTATLILTINNSTSSSVSATACDSYVWSENGQTYTQSGTYTHVSTNASGCPHTATLILTINNSSSSSVSATACDSYIWLENGQTYTQSGTYTFVSTNASGCPHTATLILTINNSSSSSVSATTCDSYVWSENGQTYTQSGTYTYVSTNASGCPHTATLILTINNSTSSSVSATACDSYVWSENGQTYTQSGTYTQVSTDASGCPHTATLILTITNSSSSSVSATTCDSYIWSENGQTYTQSGTYTHVSTNASGCPHTATLILIINNSSSSSVSATACDSYVWSENGQTYTQSGTYTHVSTNASGCPHTATISLTINNNTSSSSTISACNFYTWPENGQTYTQSGVFTHSKTNASGCTHLSTLNLTINQNTASSESVIACNSYFWPVNNTTYTQSGTYFHVGTNAAGCQHTYMLQLTIHQGTSSSESATACNSFMWNVNGNTYTSSGTYTHSGLNQNGCPHTYTLILTINSSSQSSTNVVACGSYTWSVNNVTYLNSGTYTHVSTNASGCPHTSILNITISSGLAVNCSVVSHVSCFGGSDGSVSLNITGGIPPYIITGSTSGLSADTYSYIVSDAAGCTAVCSATITEPGKISGNMSVTAANCGISNGTATANVSGGTPPYTYLWSDNQTTNPATGLAAGSYSVTVTDQNGCTARLTGNVPGVGVLPDPAGTISGPNGVCRNNSGIIYSIAPVSGASSYDWLLPSGITGSSNTNSITVSISSNYSGGFICVVPVNSCGSGMQACMNIPVFTAKPAQPGNIVGPVNPCGPIVVTYSVPAVPNTSTYMWTVSGTGLSILSGNGTNSIQVSIPSGFGQGTVSVTAQNCIGISSPRSVLITGIPVHSNSLNGPAFACANTSNVNYSINPVIGAGNSYVWSTIGDMTVVSSNLNSCVVNFGPNFTTGSLNVTTSSACGPFTKSYTIRSTPLQPGSISGPGTNLCNLSGVTYSIAAVANATSYAWTVPAGVNITANTGLSITVNFTPAFTGTGNICVAAVNSCGPGVERCYSVTARPGVPSDPNGPLSVCKSNSAVNYTILPVSGAVSYTWSITGGATISPTGTSATVNYNSATSNQAIITVNAVNSCGASQPGRSTVMVNLGCRTTNHDMAIEDLKAFPNPTSGRVTFSMNSTSDSEYFVILRDILGKEIQTEKIQVKSGANILEMDLGKYPKGIYMVSFDRIGEKSNVIRILVQ
ncbi:MAG: T9SS C-terminal target domain-containing protein, partial [Bacteroidetes bacterium]